MFIMTEETESEATLNFLPGREVLPASFETSIELKRDQDLTAYPLAEALFTIDGITRILLAHDFIGITKSDETSWPSLKPRLLALIMKHLDADSAVATEAATPATIDDRIIAVIEEEIRPFLEQDGGDIAYCGFEEGIVTVKLKGACSGCPHAAITLKNGVERLLKARIPEVLRVRPDHF